MHEAAEEAECEEAAKRHAEKAEELEASEMEPSFGAENMTWGGFSSPHRRSGPYTLILIAGRLIA